MDNVTLATNKTAAIEIPGLKVSIRNGLIDSNMDLLESVVQQVSNSYKVAVYDGTREDRLALMKDDRAQLNKLSKAIDNERKKIKKDFLVPLESFEAKAKALVALIAEPCAEIDRQAKQIEAEMREEKKTAIREYFKTEAEAANLDSENANLLYVKIFQESWANQTTSGKTYKTAITQAIQSFVDGIATVQGMNSDFEEEGLTLFKETLDVSKAVMAIQAAEKRRDELLAKEKERLAEEKRRMEEAARRAEEQRKEAEARAERQRIEAEKKAAEEKKRAQEEAKRIEEQRKAAQAEAERQAKLREKAEAERKVALEAAEKAALEAKKAQAALLNNATSGAVLQPEAAKGTVLVSFNELDWDLLKAYCDENFIGYTVRQ